MTHLTEEQITMWYYGEAEGRASAEEHLAACGECRRRLEALRRELEWLDQVPVPERGAEYGAEVWRRIEGKLDAAAPRKARVIEFPRRRWMAIGAVAALVVLSFYLGRFSRTGAGPEMAGGGTRLVPAGAVSSQVRERILLVTVGDHLEKSQMVLAEIINARPGRPFDISSERERAQDLVDSNRLYRQAALQSGDVQVAAVLDDLERVLLDIARSPETLASPEVERIRRRIEDQGLLFKIRVVGANATERGEAVAADARL